MIGSDEQVRFAAASSAKEEQARRLREESSRIARRQRRRQPWIRCTIRSLRIERRPLLRRQPEMGQDRHPGLDTRQRGWLTGRIERIEALAPGMVFGCKSTKIAAATAFCLAGHCGALGRSHSFFLLTRTPTR